MNLRVNVGKKEENKDRSDKEDETEPEKAMEEREKEC